VISRRSRTFRELYSRLPAQARELAVKNFQLWQANPAHPSLHFKELPAGRWSARIGLHYRALGVKRPDGAMLWTWIGTHEDYNRLS
jgi:hypothetical protein